MMKETLLNLVEAYTELNKALDEKLIDMEVLKAIEADLTSSFEADFERLRLGVDKMKNLDLSIVTSPNNEQYLDAMVNIYVSLNYLENYFIDLREVHTKMSKTFRYLSGEISLEEYEDDGKLEVEYTDDIESE